MLLLGSKSGAAAGAVTAAVFVSVPTGVFAGNVPVIVKRTTPPGSRLTGTLIGPVPEAGHEAVRRARQTQFEPTRGGVVPVSVTTAPTTALGPLLMTWTRNRTREPATAGEG